MSIVTTSVSKHRKVDKKGICICRRHTPWNQFFGISCNYQDHTWHNFGSFELLSEIQNVIFPGYNILYLSLQELPKPHMIE
jgi:hypothetical protein